MSAFRIELQSLINRHSLENGSNTPDFILARYLERCLTVFNETLTERAAWYDPKIRAGAAQETPPARCRPLLHVFNVGEAMCECGAVPFGKPSNTPVETPAGPAERTVWTKSTDSDPYCVHCGKTWDMHICDGRSSCPTSNR